MSETPNTCNVVSLLAELSKYDPRDYTSRAEVVSRFLFRARAQGRAEACRTILNRISCNENVPMLERLIKSYAAQAEKEAGK